MDITEINQNFSRAMEAVEEEGLLIIERYKKPVYVVMKYELYEPLETFFNRKKKSNEIDKGARAGMQKQSKRTLHEAMCMVLETAPNKTMRYNELAERIWDERLYAKRDGGKASAGQILLRAKNYENLFEIIDNIYIVQK